MHFLPSSLRYSANRLHECKSRDELQHWVYSWTILDSDSHNQSKAWVWRLGYPVHFGRGDLCPHFRRKKSIMVRKLIGAIRHPRSDTGHPRFDIRHPTFDIQHPSSQIWHPTSDIRDLTSYIRHPRFDIRHPTTDIRDSTSDIRHPKSDIPDLTSDIWHPRFEIRHPPRFDIRRPTSEIWHPTTGIRHPRFDIRHLKGWPWCVVPTKGGLKGNNADYSGFV